MTAGSHLNAVRWASAGQRSSRSRARLTGIENTAKREKDDFYPTPPQATQALLAAEQFDGPIWEPACGDGAISKVLDAAGYEVVSSDLVDRGYLAKHVPIDFLMERQSWAPNIVTNPPFRLAVPFVRKALELTTTKVAMICKLTFLEGKERGELFERHPPTRVWVFKRRVAFTRGSEHAAKVGGGMMCFAWFIWEHGYTGKPTLGWL